MTHVIKLVGWAKPVIPPPPPLFMWCWLRMQGLLHSTTVLVNSNITAPNTTHAAFTNPLFHPVVLCDTSTTPMHSRFQLFCLWMRHIFLLTSVSVPVDLQCIVTLCFHPEQHERCCCILAGTQPVAAIHHAAWQRQHPRPQNHACSLQRGPIRFCHC